MSRRRIAPGLIVWLVGLLLGTLAREPAAQPPDRIDNIHPEPGYQMLAADFHVHSFPGDGTLLPWDVAREARRHGLHVVALTNHNHMLSWRAARLASRWMPAEVLVLPGEEVTAPRFHLAAIGIGTTVPWMGSPRDVIDAVHAQGGVAIAAHPSQRFDGYDRRALAGLDGADAAHPLAATDRRNREDFDAFYARAARERTDLAAIGSSDFHREWPIGLCRTYVFATERTQAGVLDAVRQGRTAACDPRGITIGREPWATMARGACRAAARSADRSPARSASVLHRLAVGCALMGMAALVLQRRVTA